MPRLINDPVAELRELVPAPSQPRRVIGLVGLPGAGKSTVAEHWCKAVNQWLGEATMQCLGMDGFHLSRAELAALPNATEALARRGAEWTFDPAALRQHLLALRAVDANAKPLPCTWPAFDHAQGDPVPDAVVIAPSTRLVLVEGLYLLLPDADWALQALFDTVWFLDINNEQAQAQLTRRHMQVWGWSEIQARERVQASDALNAQRVWATRDRADAWVLPATARNK